MNPAQRLSVGAPAASLAAEREQQSESDLGLPEVRRDRAFLLLRYTLIAATAYLQLVEASFAMPSPGVVSLIVIALASNVGFTLLPSRVRLSTTFSAGVVLFDTAWITLLLMATPSLTREFYTLYFFILLLAAMGENLRLIALGAAVVCATYLYVLATGDQAPSLWRSPSLIRIPFLLAAAGFYGYLVDRAREAQRRAQEHAHTIEVMAASEAQLAERQSELVHINQKLRREIQERQRAEGVAYHAQAAAETATRVMGDFFANVSHELRTPIHVIFGMTEMVLDGKLDVEQRANLQRARKAALELSRLVDDMLGAIDTEENQTPPAATPRR